MSAWRFARSRAMGGESVHETHLERRSIHTWTDPENHAMYATNRAFGYRPVERMHQVQIRD